MKYKRIFAVVMDSVGAGAMPDSERFGDIQVETLGHIAKAYGHLNIPNLKSLGLANLHDTYNVSPVANPLGYYTKMMERSNGKDTMTGHWEMMGLNIQTPFKKASP